MSDTKLNNQQQNNPKSVDIKFIIDKLLTSKRDFKNLKIPTSRNATKTADNDSYSTVEYGNIKMITYKSTNNKPLKTKVYNRQPSMEDM